jgi:hypothetical protein
MSDDEKWRPISEGSHGARVAGRQCYVVESRDGDFFTARVIVGAGRQGWICELGCLPTLRSAKAAATRFARTHGSEVA